MKEIQPCYEGLFGNEKVIQNDQLLRIYRKLLKALNEIRVQIAINYQPVMKFKEKSFNTYIAQVKAKEFVTDVDDIEFEDWCVTNTHAYFWYCADVSKSPLLKTAIENALKNHQTLTCLKVYLIKSMTFENINLSDLYHQIQPSPMF
jgi:hypothetical protein